MNLFTFVAAIFIISISNSKAAPTRRGYGREDLGHDPASHKVKEGGRDLQEEGEEVQEEQRQVAMQVKDLLRQLRQHGRWKVEVRAKRMLEDDEGETSIQNWHWETEIKPRDSRAGLHGSDDSHSTLISKGW